MYIYIYIYIYMHIYVCVNRYNYIYIHTHTHIHISFSLSLSPHLLRRPAPPIIFPIHRKPARCFTHQPCKPRRGAEGGGARAAQHTTSEPRCALGDAGGEPTRAACDQSWGLGSLYCVSQSSCYAPPPTCKGHPISKRMHGHCAIYASPPTPPFLCHTPYTIGDGNIL